MKKNVVVVQRGGRTNEHCCPVASMKLPPSLPLSLPKREKKRLNVANKFVFAFSPRSWWLRRWGCSYAWSATRKWLLVRIPSLSSGWSSSRRWRGSPRCLILGFVLKAWAKLRTRGRWGRPGNPVPSTSSRRSRILSSKPQQARWSKLGPRIENNSPPQPSASRAPCSPKFCSYHLVRSRRRSSRRRRRRREKELATKVKE